MNAIEFLSALFLDYTLRTVALGSALIGLTAGCLGAFAVLRRQSLLGDAVSHAALPGVALAFMLTLTRQPLVLLFGAAVAGWIGTQFVQLITRNTRIKQDSALGIVLSVFFGLGMVLLTVIQRIPAAGQAGLSKYLFGNAATLLREDVVTMGVLCLIVLGLVALFWKEFKLLTFDTDYTLSLGFPAKALDIGLTTLIVLAIVLGLQTVGVVLMSALLVAPAAAARQWTDRLEIMVILAGVFGAFSGIAGAALSSTLERLPTGPTTVLVISLVVLVSLLFAPARGIFWDWLRHRRQHRQVKVATVLAAMYQLAQSHADHTHPHDAAALDAVGVHSAERTLRELEKRGLVTCRQRMWAFTEAGLDEARRVAQGEAAQ